MKTTFILGLVLLLYGSIKLLIGFIALSLSKQNKPFVEKHPILSKIIKVDTTIAGKVIEISIIVFALYSISRGLYFMKAIKNPTFLNIMTHYSTVYILYGIVGIFLTVFYTSLVYSNIRNIISYDNSEMPNYKLTGIGSGLMFLIVMFVVYIYHNFKKHTQLELTLLIVLFSLTVTSLIMIIIETYDKIKKAQHEIVTMLMIPLAGI